MRFEQFATVYLTTGISVRRVKVLDDDGGATVLVEWTIKRRRAGTKGHLRADYTITSRHTQRVARDRLSVTPV